MVALRIDDIGASTKEFNYYSKRRRYNFGILRHRRLLGAWAPYPEMTPHLWAQTFEVLRRFQAKLTVAVTACWVEGNGDLTPFPNKFPQEAAILKEGLEEGLLEIANHGLTHCVLENLSFKPKLWGSVRTYHREFWGWIDSEIHYQHLQQSQEILQNFFQTEVTTLVPPGNVFASHTIDAAKKLGIQMLNCQTQNKISTDIRIVGNEHVIDFHDRELVLFGVSWLEKKLALVSGKEAFCFVKELQS